MQREKITFDPNVPVTVTLQYPVGKIVSGRFGDQVMWGLQDDRVMFLDLAVAEKINNLNPQQGESFTITKLWNGQKSQPVRWDVNPSPATERMRAARFGRQIPADADESEVGRQVRATLENISEGRPAAAPRPQAVPARVYPGASVSAPAPGIPAANMQRGYQNTNTGNSNSLVDEANTLVDVYAAVLDRALTTYQGRIKPDEIRSIVLSCYIQQGKQAKYAAA